MTSPKHIADPPAVEPCGDCRSGTCAVRCSRGTLHCHEMHVRDCGASDPKAGEEPVSLDGWRTCRQCGALYPDGKVCLNDAHHKSAPNREAPKPPEVPERISVAIAWGQALCIMAPGEVAGGKAVAVDYVPLSALTEALGVLGVGLDALPKCCCACGRPATEAEFVKGSRSTLADDWWCHDCAGHDGVKTSELPWAPFVIAAQALIARHGVNRG